MSSRTQVLSEVDKLVNSSALHGSESLCKLLRYLAHHALEHPGVPLKEYQIATEVFGRQADFDPQLDSMVRVQAGRLRTKLAEHYSSAGASDAMWLDLPKGAYVLAFHEGPPGGAKNHGGAAHDGRPEGYPESVTPALVLPRRWVAAVATLSLLLAAAVGVIAMLAWGHKATPATVAANEGVAPAFPIFWKGFLAGPEQPLVIFSNAAFVGRPDVDMHYYDASKDPRATILDHYTGVGEVLGVHDLDVVFEELHQPIRIKRGSLFTLDDAKNNDLIFIGSPAENLALLEIPSTTQFTFRKLNSGPRHGNTEIINEHPLAGEPGEFLATPPNQALVEDYAVIALVPGMNPARSELILAGTTTIGTQAAVEFVCSPNLLEELLQKLSVKKPSELKPFEAVIRVKVARGVPVESTVAALRSVTQP
jgi:hypothetical protein